MQTNLLWLAAAFGIGWAIIFLYVVWISRRVTGLQRRVVIVEEQMRGDVDSV
jgi:CcmD family protein